MPSRRSRLTSIYNRQLEKIVQAAGRVSRAELDTMFEPADRPFTR